MVTTYFYNQGALPLTGITTFGVSAKETESPFGYFGTGLKYSIATLLRTGHSLRLNISGTQYVFGTTPDKLRNTKFDQVWMREDKPHAKRIVLPFATDYGKNWEIWQVYRELYCNAHDEPNPQVQDTPITPEHEEYTLFTVTGQELHNVHLAPEQVIRQPSTFVHENAHVTVYENPSDYVYYQGIRVFDVRQENKRCVFTYEARRAQLTEDRTLKYSYNLNAAIATWLYTTATYDQLTRLANFPTESYESELNIEYESTVPSDDFISFAHKYRGYNDPGLPHRLFRSCDEHLKQRNRDQARSVEQALDEREQAKLNQAITDMRRCGFTTIDDYPIRVVADLGGHALAEADMDTGTILLSYPCLRFNREKLMSVLLEEYVHLRYRMYDETRELQTWLFEELAAAKLNLAELKGE